VDEVDNGVLLVNEFSAPGWQKVVFVNIENSRSWPTSIKNRGCVAIDHRIEACTPHPTYVSLP
jgi:hypothetical protein